MIRIMEEIFKSQQAIGQRCHQFKQKLWKITNKKNRKEINFTTYVGF